MCLHPCGTNPSDVFGEGLPGEGLPPLIGVLPTWGIVALIGVIGAVRPYLKLADYTAYAAVMTPLITMLNELGNNVSWAVLRERAIDTLIGCAIGLCVGYLPWRMWANRHHER